MRILHIIKNFDFGGAENHLCELANSLDLIGNKIFIIGGSGRQQAKLNPNITFIPSRLRNLFFPMNLLMVAYYVIHSRIQVIHAHQRYPILLASIIGKMTRTPVVSTVHGRSQYDLRHCISRKYSDKIIFVSKFVLKASSRFPDIQDKVVFIPNGVPTAINKPSNGSFRISYISRMDSKHSFVILLFIQKVLPRLIKDYPMITFNIVGSGHCLQEVKKEALQLNQACNREVCIISGFQPEVMAHIQESALILGVGRVALEALACGVPVLSVNKKHLGTMISRKNYSWYKENNFLAIANEPPNADSFYDLLNNFFVNPSYWQNETGFLKKMVDEEFNSLKIAVRIESLYKELI